MKARVNPEFKHKYNQTLTFSSKPMLTVFNIDPSFRKFNIKDHKSKAIADTWHDI